MRYYPVGLNLRGKDALVVGAGKIAERKIKSLLGFGAQVKVVAPHANPAVQKLCDEGKISFSRKEYKTSDIKGARLLIAATSDKDVNRRVAADAKRKGIWANVVDDTKHCEFISMAMIKKNGIVISVSSDGKNPGLSKDFRIFLEKKIDEFNSGGNKS